MKKSVLRICLLGLLAAGITGSSVPLRAQDTTTTTNATVETKHAKSKKLGVIPFHGTVKAVDATAKTITVGERSIRITSETKIEKDGKPATLEEVTAGESVNGAYKKGEDGKLDASVIRMGMKAAKHSKKKAAATDSN